MERLGDAVRGELGRFPGHAQLDAVVAVWPAAVGHAVARNAWPARLARDGTLHVATSSSAWAFELGQLAREVLAQLSERLGEAAPPALRFAPGRLPERGGSESVGDTAAKLDKLSPEQLAVGERIAAGVTSAQLRDALARAAATSVARASDGRGV